MEIKKTGGLIEYLSPEGYFNAVVYVDLNGEYRAEIPFKFKAGFIEGATKGVMPDFPYFIANGECPPDGLEALRKILVEANKSQVPSLADLIVDRIPGTKIFANFEESYEAGFQETMKIWEENQDIFGKK
jgi:hypothetical protein